MSSSTQSSGAAKARRPERLRGFARMALVLGWVAFWLNTALFLPCCAIAAVGLGGQGGIVSQAISTVQPAHHPDDTQSGSPVHSPDSPCGDTLNSGPPLVEAYEVLTSGRSPLEGFAADASVATTLTAPKRSATLVLAWAAPPPSLRLYLRTRRLLI